LAFNMELEGNMRTVMIAARNIKPGDFYITSQGDQFPVVSVYRIDLHDRVLVGFTYTNTRTIGRVTEKTSFRVTDRIKVKKSGNSVGFSIDWTPKDVNGNPIR
jgi:hypothetical protein